MKRENVANVTGIEKAVDVLIAVGIGVFILVIVLSLTYQGYGQVKTQMTSANVGTGIIANFTTYGGSTVNTFGSNLPLAVFVVVMSVIILAIVLALKGNGRGLFGE